MGLFSGLGRAFGFGGSDQKAVNLSAPTAVVGAFGGSSTSGIPITQDIALTQSVFFGAVKILSEDVAKLPLRVLRSRKDGGRDVDTKHALAKVLRHPNSWQTPFEFIEFLTFCLVVRGNAFAVILRGPRGTPEQFVPVSPDRVTLLTDTDGELWYQVGRGSQHEHAVLREQPLTIPARDIIHIRNLSKNGLVGMSMLEQVRETLGLAIATEQHGTRLFAQGARPSGVLVHPGKLNESAATRLRATWEAAHGGVTNFGKTAVLEEGMKYETIAMTSTDAEWLASRKFQVEEIARFFRIPLHMLQSLDKASFNNIEHQSRSYYDQTLMSYLERIESAFNTKFDLEAEGRTLEFDTNKLLRADMKSRFESYAIARQWGWKSANDVLIAEGENPIGPSGDIYLVPMNMIPAEHVLNPPDNSADVAAKILKDWNHD
jgi:HK97 family phage portal protein